MKGAVWAVRIGLMSVCLVLASCATQGRIYDRAASEAFRIGETTPEEALAALGPANPDLVRPDGDRVLRWHYRRRAGLAVTEHVLSARFDVAGRMVYLHNPGVGQVIDPF